MTPFLFLRKDCRCWGWILCAAAAVKGGIDLLAQRLGVDLAVEKSPQCGGDSLDIREAITVLDYEHGDALRA